MLSSLATRSVDGSDLRRLDAIESGRRVIRAEARALDAIAETFGSSFGHSVEVIAAATGRVVVTGMGKSGHVARKIAATLASTGTPALFVHPGEASHGDLGMITRGDVVLALSNSGETSELKDVLTHAKRFGIPVIALVGRAPSTLADAGDVVLALPPMTEACPMGLAPTTSTTAMLAMGDALAVALLEWRGFTASDFAVFHPGGKLGVRLVRVEQLMHAGEEVPLVAPDAPIRDAVLEMTKKRLGCVGVVDPHGRLVGIVTDGDLRRHMSADLLDRPVHAVMTAGPRTIERRALAAEAVTAMNGPPRPVTVLFVIEDGRPVGALHMHDCLRAGIV